MVNICNLVYVHVGKNLPEYFYDSLYQTLLVNHYGVKIFILVDQECVSVVRARIDKFNINNYFSNCSFYYNNLINIIPLNVLDTCFLEKEKSFQKYQSILQDKYSNIGEFRDGFWVTTTMRFFYLQAFMNIFQMENCFHIENDIMMYESFNDIMNDVYQEHGVKYTLTKIWMVQDSPQRVVPSLLFVPNQNCIDNLTEFIGETLEASPYFVNDMDILGRFPDKLVLRIIPKESGYSIVYDGAAIGQYVGGIDNRNNNTSISTVGFINETSVFKPDTCEFSRRSVKTDEHIVPIKTLVGLSKQSRQLFSVANAHVHCKELYKFSSVFDLSKEDLISGDKILTLCDFVITTRDILMKNIQQL